MARSYIGAKVKLSREIVTRGGTKYKVGTVMRVIDSTSGGLTLQCYKLGWRQTLYGLRKYEVTVLEWKKKGS